MANTFLKVTGLKFAYGGIQAVKGVTFEVFEGELVSLVEERRQTFIARSGIDITETPRDVSFCAHAMLGDEIMVVPDATQDTLW